MASSKKRVITSIAWCLAFESTAEMALAAVYGGWSGYSFGSGRNPDEVIAAGQKTWDALEKVVPPLAGLIGLALGLAGCLPGTEDK